MTGKNWNAAGNPTIIGKPKVVEGPRKRDDTPTEFGRFETLTKTLVGVPKTELDEKRNDG